jgi:AcrR family transcriptional regulator
MPDGFDAQAHKLRKREAFLTAGSYFFNTKGFKGTSLDEIANHLQVTKGAFYYHIKDKEDLLLQCFERSLKLTEAAQNLAQEEADTGIAQVEIVCRQIFYLQNSGEGPLIRYNNLLSLATGHQAQIKRRTRQTSQQFGNFIDAGCIDGSIRPINANVAQHMLAGAIMASMDVPLWKSMGAIQPESIAYFHLFFNGLQRRPTTPTELP